MLYVVVTFAVALTNSVTCANQSVSRGLVAWTRHDNLIYALSVTFTVVLNVTLYVWLNVRS